MKKIFIQDIHGRVVDPLDPKPEDFHICVIAWSLAMKCRFNGHSRKFFSVAQHSVLVSRYCNPENALWGLLHELDEVYFPDIPSPLKALFPGWEQTTGKHLEAGAKNFGLKTPIPEDVKYADLMVLHAEARDFITPCEIPWTDNLPGCDEIPKIVALTPEDSRLLFIARFCELMNLPSYLQNYLSRKGVVR
jgi:hypothetical protein